MSEGLWEVTLPQRLIKIGTSAFCVCTSWLEITICCTVESIGEHVFERCELMTKVEFEFASFSAHWLRTIGRSAFAACSSLQIIKVPSSVKIVDLGAFEDCGVLVEADLSADSAFLNVAPYKL